MLERENPGGKRMPVDCIYIGAFGGDARLTRICVASIRYFYPDIPIRVLPGSPLKRGLVKELERYWNTGVADLPGGDYGSGFVKLEPLFGPPGERFLMLDADTVLAGPVLDLWREGDAPFLVDEEEQPDGEIKRLYFDWEKVREAIPGTQRPKFVFNTGQWFGTAGLVTRDDFSPLVEWTMPRRLRYAEHFMTGDQGIQNYVFNKRVADGSLQVQLRSIMFWPVRPMDRMNAESVATRVAPTLVVHWAGLKKLLLRNVVRPDLLAFFESYYYQRLPLGQMRKIAAAILDVASQWLHYERARVRRKLRQYGLARTPNPQAGELPRK